MSLVSSTPSLTKFKPLPSQWEILKLIHDLDYSKGVQEILLSGSVGSAKSLTLAHVAIIHCLKNPKANFMIGRLALPQLKETLCNKITQHLEGVDLDVTYNTTTGCFRFPNGSRITAVSWSDKNYEKLGSYEFSAGAIEELVETKDRDAYDKILQRIGRLPHIKESFLLSATNPSSPQHWGYKHLIQSRSDNVHVFYSNTFDNPYLPKSYIEGLKERLDAKQARRMIYGEWVEINQEVIYYEYDSTHNFIDNTYDIDPRYPIRLMYDFNIAVGKPLSLVLGQYKNDSDTWHIFDEIIIEGQRTADSLEEMESRGYFKNYKSHKFIIHGDAAGRAKDTRSNRSDYDIIDKFLANQDDRPDYEMQVPRKNPSIRDRHNAVNGYLCNANDKRKLFVYKGCDIVDEGFRLTCLKDKGQYIEDDSKHYQHCTTAIGYGVNYVVNVVKRQSEGFGKVL